MNEARVNEEPVASGTREVLHSRHHLVPETYSTLGGCTVELAGSPGAVVVSSVRGQAFPELNNSDSVCQYRRLHLTGRLGS